MKDYGIMDEAKRLYSLGFGVHWIRPGSKAPVKKGWADGTRQSFEELERTYKKGFGLGVRLGKASLLNRQMGYLVNIDVDIKSKKKSAREEALFKLGSFFPGLALEAPRIRTGNGFRLLVRVMEPLSSQNLARSERLCKAKMPSSEINDAQIAYVKKGMLSMAELGDGMRVRASWEIDFLSDGRQGVFPPSIHPDTGLPYAWERPFMTLDDIPLITEKDLRRALGDRYKETGSNTKAGSLSADETLFFNSWKREKIDIEISSLAPKWIAAIRTGEGVEDRSRTLQSVMLAMVGAGYSDGEILSVLTDRDNWLSKAAYQHAKANRPMKAAQWLYRFGLKKAREKASPEHVFKDVPEETPLLNDIDAEKQEKELLDWRSEIKRRKDGSAYGTFENAALILKHTYGDAFQYDDFTNRDRLTRDTPFGKAGEEVSDVTILMLKKWLVNEWRLEMQTHLLHEVEMIFSQLNAIDSAKEALRRLPMWDGKERLGSWLTDHFEAEDDPEYVGEVFTKWVTAAVARIHNPGMKFDWMIILEGAQGRGKSIFGQVLFGEDLWMDHLGDLKRNDTVLQMQGKVCIEFPELSSLRKSDLESVKAFITRQTDRARAPWGKKHVDYRRRCVFYGTTNESVYLKDTTGNRRFNPIKVGTLDVEQLRKDREQLLAEAQFLYLNDLIDNFFLSAKIIKYAEETREDKRVQSDSDLFEDHILAYIDKNPPEQFPWNNFSLIDLFSFGPLAEFNNDGRNNRIAAEAIKKMGGIRRKTEMRNLWALDISKYAGSSATPSAPRGVVLN